MFIAICKRLHLSRSGLLEDHLVCNLPSCLIHRKMFFSCVLVITYIGYTLFQTTPGQTFWSHGLLQSQPSVLFERISYCPIHLGDLFYVICPRIASSQNFFWRRSKRSGSGLEGKMLESSCSWADTWRWVWVFAICPFWCDWCCDWYFLIIIKEVVTKNLSHSDGDQCNFSRAPSSRRK